MRYTENETIAAVSTGLSAGGIGIVRISGPEAVSYADRIFRSASGKLLREADSHTIHYGTIERDGEMIDEVLVSVMLAPRTYTREDTVEINCHGGIFVTQQVLEAAIHAGARPAEPGEFTKKAFLNGRIDLSQAEAVMDLIRADNAYATKSALMQLKGSLRDRILSCRKTILHETAFIEAALDDPEHFDLDGYGDRLLEIIRKTEKEIRALIDTSDDGKILKEGIATVILGRPNVGKSTLLNALSGTEAAIVTDIAGTTRDVLEQHISIGGIPLRIMDTAGIRDTEDQIERIGVERARRCAEEADLILYVCDAADEITEEDLENISSLQGKNLIVLMNKSDLVENTNKSDFIENRNKSDFRESADKSDFIENPGKTEYTISEEAFRLKTENFQKEIDAPVIAISARENSGMEQLRDYIMDLFLGGEVRLNEQVYITNIRHKQALEAACSSLLLVEESIENGMPEDLYTVDLMDAYESLGLVTGDEVSDDLVDEIFASFCMGK